MNFEAGKLYKFLASDFIKNYGITNKNNITFYKEYKENMYTTEIKFIDPNDNIVMLLDNDFIGITIFDSSNDKKLGTRIVYKVLYKNQVYYISAYDLIEEIN